jgi:LacI family transcriptional regulator
MAKINRIAVILPLSSAYDRHVYEGVINWMHATRKVEIYSWPNLHFTPTVYENVKERIPRFGISGILTDLWDIETARLLRKLRLPIVDIGGAWPARDAVSVHVDNHAVGRLAARHLLDKGLRHFAFCGPTIPLHCRQRREAFTSELGKAGFSCAAYEENIASIPSSDAKEQRLRDWLDALPKPVGILCWYDFWAIPVQSVCRRAGIHVPDEVALIGVDNDELVCHELPVPLTSVDVGPMNIGFRAMELLDRIIRTGRSPRRHIVLPPGNVIARQSSDLLAVQNPDVAEALRFIVASADQPILVRDVLKEVPISRRGLEFQFQKLFGRTPRQQIQHVHVERAKMLLDKNDLSLAMIAERSGFKSQSAFTRVFRRFAHCTPGQYRRQLLRPEPLGRR